jgi:tRNA(adenine34) deaminase
MPMPEDAGAQHHEAMMKHALTAARRALDRGDFPVGCIIARGHDIVAEGGRSGSAGPRPNETDHAEITALRRMGTRPDEVPPNELVLYATMEPCLMCYGAILLSGIPKIVYAYEDVMGGGTACRLDSLPPLYAKRRIAVIPGVCRRESLELFRRFFANPDNTYWRGSALAEYTLRQE